MFHFPAFPPTTLCVQVAVTGLSILPGFPIRKSSDHSSVDSSPRHIAASHVLHRLLVPRHPPCALTNLATKMLASTVQFSKNGRPQPPTRTHPTGAVSRRSWSVPQPTPEPHPQRAGPGVLGHRRSNRSLRTQQRTTRNPRHQPDPFHPHPERQGVLNIEPAEKASKVSVPRQ